MDLRLLVCVCTFNDLFDLLQVHPLPLTLCKATHICGESSEDAMHQKRTANLKFWRESSFSRKIL